MQREQQAPCSVPAPAKPTHVPSGPIPGQGVPVTSVPLKYVVAPTDSDFCNITLADIADLQVQPNATR